VIASLNFNSDDLACCIGRVQLKKLPDFVERRRAAAKKAASLMDGLKSVTIPEQLPGANHSYRWWRLRYNGDAMTCDKELYCRALAAEGMQVMSHYGAALPQSFKWFTQKKVFGSSAYPWSAPEYKGGPDQKYPCPIAEKSVLDHFNLTINESYSERDVRDLADIFEKVENAFKICQV
jgi:dTDP-4-amino-4,6-dideoxygalactose transaminase